MTADEFEVITWNEIEWAEKGASSPENDAFSDPEFDREGDADVPAVSNATDDIYAVGFDQKTVDVLPTVTKDLIDQFSAKYCHVDHAVTIKFAHIEWRKWITLASIALVLAFGFLRISTNDSSAAVIAGNPPTSSVIHDELEASACDLAEEPTVEVTPHVTDVTVYDYAGLALQALPFVSNALIEAGEDLWQSIVVVGKIILDKLLETQIKATIALSLIIDRTNRAVDSPAFRQVFAKSHVLFAALKQKGRKLKTEAMKLAGAIADDGRQLKLKALVVMREFGSRFSEFAGRA